MQAIAGYAFLEAADGYAHFGWERAGRIIGTELVYRLRRWLVAQALLLVDKILVTSKDIRQDMGKEEATSKAPVSLLSTA